MSNSILTPTVYTKEVLRLTENMLRFSKGVTREYDDKFAVSGAKIGDTLNVRLPAMYTGTSGASLSTEDYTERSMPVVLTTQYHVDTTFTTKDTTLSLDEFADRVLKPKLATLANKVDYDGLTAAKNGFNSLVGTAGTTPATAAAILSAGQKLDEFGVPRDGSRWLVIDPAANASLINAMTGFFHSARSIESQFEDGAFVDATNTLGFKIGMDQNVVKHTTGPLGGTPLVNGASQGITTGWASTTSLITDGWTAAAASRLKAGDVFTIANVNAVNPMNKNSTGSLMQFVVTADVSSDGSGNLTAVISPAIISAGPFQNVSAAPADNAAITVVGTASTVYPRNIAFHKEGIVLACADLDDVSQFGAWGGRRTYKGISMRVARQYAISTDTVPTRVDILYGWKVVRPSHGVQVTG